MANILIVSDQERLIAIFTSPGFLPDAKVRAARTIEQALAAQANGRYQFIFIQERLGEISGHILAHRVAAGSTGKKPRIIMLANGERNGDGSGKQVQTIRCAGLSDEQIASAAREILAGQERKPRSRRTRSKSQDQAEPDAGHISTPLPTVETVADLVEIAKVAAQPGNKPLPRETVADSAPDGQARSRFQEELDSVLGENGNEALTTPEKPSASDKDSSPAPLLVKWGKEPLAQRILKRVDGRKPLAKILVAVTVAIILALFAATKMHKAPGIAKTGAKKTLPGFAKATVDATPPKKELRSLPSFIPLSSLDSGYGKSHPGWERYLTPAAEFRVYRERGIIRAIQVIDRSGQGVQTGLFTSALNEIASSQHYLIEGRENKGSFQIEKGQLANGAKIIVYRHSPGSRVKALVIDLH
ncbi:MAG: hypothetical protein VB050_04610 [Geobacteraceae bacterium]|nr:hypothetical protein [Geobacteraceae bacterium]